MVMTVFEIILMGLALSLDAMIVSFSYGLVTGSNKFKNSMMLSLSFGFFQFLMPFAGFYFSSLVYSQLKIFSKWIIFAIFSYLAFKFIQSSMEKEKKTYTNCISCLCLLWLAIATSIDALGAGISIRFMDIDVLIPALCIGFITFLSSFCGFWFASLFKKIPTKYIEIIGALLLIYLAICAVI